MTQEAGPIVVRSENEPSLSESRVAPLAKTIAMKLGLRKLLLPVWRLAWMNRTIRSWGWHRSSRVDLPVDAAGNPIPWWAYPAIAFLDRRIQPEMRVFEFGSGNSTLWLAQRAGPVVTTEHDARWASYLRPLLPSNARMIEVPDPLGIPGAIESEGDFNIVVIDGPREHRDTCALASLRHLTPDGVLIWDDTDRSVFDQTMPQFAQAGFRELSFEGLQPITPYMCRTTILYRDGNCLGI